ncbi:MAG TPA: M3 family oligoendopeptidase [Armatimonadaceae bacterium]|nr:M3 family oligoendopeptidase [Armatimonadaceae bacterium]
METQESAPQSPPRWRLDDLYLSPEDPRIAQSLDEVRRVSEAFAARYRGRLADLSPAEMREVIGEFERLEREAYKPAVYAGLRHAAEASPEAGAFLQHVREKATAATLPLLFFDVELTRIPRERLRALADAPELAVYRHYLRNVEARAPFRLSEAEERVLEEQSNTGRRAFIRLYEELTSNLRFTVEGFDKPLTLSQVMDLQHEPERDVRRRASDALTAGLAPEARTLAFVYNTLIQDKATEDRLRGFTSPEQSRHLANELPPEVVETVVRMSEEGYPLVARYYEAKRKILGLDRLTHYDRYAPVSQDESPVPYDVARDRCLSAFAGFHPEYAAAARAFFEGNWIDAEPRAGKRGGAFCSFVTPDLHPYIFLNYLNKAGDVRTLAHELGHGIHTSLAREHGFLEFHSTLPIAEVASTFAEQLVFAAAGRETADPKARLALYAEQIEQAIATIFRQTALYRFEQAAHRERRERGELSVERFGQIWQECVGAMFADSVELLPDHALWWSYIRHFIATPFYVYAYTAGEMLALALFHRYEEEADGSFAPKFVAFLRAGGSQSPEEVVEPLGVDLKDPAFWRGALAVLEAQVEEFEALAAQCSSTLR